MADKKLVARRIEQRKDALDNSGIGEKGVDFLFSDYPKSLADFEKSSAHRVIRHTGEVLSNASVHQKEATSVVIHTGYQELGEGKLKVFIKRVLRKLLYIFFGWYILPIHQKQSQYNSKLHAANEALLKATEEQTVLINDLLHRTDILAGEVRDKQKQIELLEERLLKSEAEIKKLKTQASGMSIDKLLDSSVPAASDSEKYFRYILSKLNITYDPALIDKDLVDYFDFENVFRGSREMIKERQKCYIDYLKTDNKDGYVLELGFGRGEMLELLKENEIPAVGVECYKPFVDYCDSRGYNVIQGDALTHLTSCEDESLNGIVLSQVAEHLNTDYLYQLIRTGYKKLRKGCCFILETPNPESISVYADFYIDANHIKPIHYNTLKYVFEKNGYLDITRSENEYSVHPYAAMMDKYAVDKASSEDEKRFYEQLKHMMFAARDFTIIARK